MHNFLKIAAIIGGAFLCSAFPSKAQEKSVWTDLNFVLQSEAWLLGTNAAGLKFTPVDTISEISFCSTTNKGAFIDYNQSNNSTYYGGEAESFFRLNKKVMLWGGISYSNFTGQNMGASAWIDPDFAPFNIIEYTDTARGEKTMETYHLSGAVSVELSDKISVGGEIDYLTANYVKNRDLRHLNMLMDLDLSLGIIYQIKRTAEIGINYNYRKRVEETNFDSFGNTDQTYSTLISWGTFWGLVESFGSDGYTGEGDNNPLIDKINTLSLQLNLNFSTKLSFFNELTFNNREGYFGVKSNQTKVYTEHSSNTLAYKGRMTYSRKKALHLFCINASHESLDNWRNNYYFDHNSESNVTFIKYNTPTKVLTRNCNQASLEYQLYWGYDDFNPKWSFAADVDYKNREQKVSVYPYYRNQSITQLIGKISIKRNFIIGQSQYTFLLGTRYSNGYGTPLEEGVYSMANDNTTNLRSTDFNLYREFEYLTTMHIATKIGFKYSRLLKQNRIRAFASLDYELTKANEINYIAGNTFNSLHLSIGCSF